MSAYDRRLNPLCAPGDAEVRIARGKEIASRSEEIEKLEPDAWSVPSQTGFGRYKVWFVRDLARCTCDDFQSRAMRPRPEPCKHIYAVLEVRQLETDKAPTPPPKTPRKQYPQHPTYTKAQQAEMRLVDQLLRDLVDDIADPPRAPGLPGPTPSPLRDEAYCAIQKVYSGLSCRRSSGVLANVAERGLLDRVPSHIVSSTFLNRPEATPILYGLLARSAIPLAGLEDGGFVAPDSTGIQTTSFGAWREQKHREKRERKWLKVHAIVGTKTHIVIRAIVTETNSGDAPRFEPLLRGALDDGFRPAAVVADKGYLSRANFELAQDLGLQAYIPFKSNSVARTGTRGTSAAWRRAFHFFQANREGFDRKYHQRSNVEATFSAIKRKFGEEIRSRTPTAQVNEVLAKLIAYNLTVVVHEMFENGIAPEFGEGGERVGRASSD